jgi:fructose 5-dehydrogenase cytochrome subunit
MRVVLAAAMMLVVLCGGARANTDQDQAVVLGRYLAIAGDCAACHTAPKGAPFAGGNPVPSPMGTIYSTNITPSKAHGIGNYTEAEFARALREGIKADGSHLYPAMPYTSYAGLSDADVHALYVYLKQSVTPVEREAPTTNLSFPFNLRFSMAFWNALFLDDHRLQTNAAHDAQWNRGAYLVRALEHCSVCHTPRGFLMEELTSKDLAGGPVGEWYAPDITSDPTSGVGAWTRDELVTYLKTGKLVGKAQAAGGMGEAVTHSLSHLNDSDLQAIAAYVKTVPAVAHEREGRSDYAWGAPANFEATLRGVGFTSNGASLYSGLCASCHGSTGAGSPDHVIPSLFHNATVGAKRPDNLVAVILHGVDREADGQRVFMPGFAFGSYVQSLSDAQIAAVATFVRNTFGQGGAVSADDVATARKGGPPAALLTLTDYAEWGAAFVLLMVVVWLGLRLLRPRSGTIK